MVNCPKCGGENTDTAKFCVECGAPLTDSGDQAPSKPQAPSEPQAASEPQAPAPMQIEDNPFRKTSSDYDPAVVYSVSSSEKPAQVPTGGLLAWSIITILLCTIPGIVATVQTAGINSCQTLEEQQKKISSAKTWCIVGTILGVLSCLGTIGAAMGR